MVDYSRAGYGNSQPFGGNQYLTDFMGRLNFGNNYMGSYQSPLSQQKGAGGFLPSMAALDNSLVNQNYIDFYNANNNNPTGTNPNQAFDPQVEYQKFMTNLKAGGGGAGTDIGVNPDLSNAMPTNAAGGQSLGGIDPITGQWRMGIDPATGKTVDTDTSNSDFNWDGLTAGIEAGSALFNAYTAWKGLGLAKDAFAHQKQLDTVNIGNQVASLKTAESDRNAYRQGLYGSGATINNTPWQTLGTGG